MSKTIESGDSLEYTDITEELCKECASCCKNVVVPIQIDDRFLEFLETTGASVSTDWKDSFSAVLNLDPCQYLGETETGYQCTIYSNRPQMCKDYNCLAWARTYGMEKLSPNLQAAKKVLRARRKRGL